MPDEGRWGGVKPPSKNRTNLVTQKTCGNKMATSISLQIHKIARSHTNTYTNAYKYTETHTHTPTHKS